MTNAVLSGVYVCYEGVSGIVDSENVKAFLLARKKKIMRDTNIASLFSSKGLCGQKLYFNIQR